MNESFFLVIPPGLEDLAVLELKHKGPDVLIRTIEKGGVTVECTFSKGLGLLAILKIPTAIYWRLTEFKCRDLPKLFQKISNLKWSRYLIGDQFRLNVMSSKSRLLHEKKIAKTVTEGIARHFQKQPPKKVKLPFAFEIQVRFFQDVCTISLNIGGDHLFKRGYKKMSARAPLRENLAAALFFGLWSELGGFKTLMDPMCGSGTFLLEAHEFWHSVTSREWDYQYRSDWLAEKFSLPPQGPSRFIGIDKNEAALEDLRESVSAIRIGNEDAAEWILYQQDFLTVKSQAFASEDLALICNPPYGERIRLPLPAKKYYPELLLNMLGLSPRGLGIIVPDRFLSLLPNECHGYKSSVEWRFTNGGIPVVFRVYRN